MKVTLPKSGDGTRSEPYLFDAGADIGTAMLGMVMTNKHRRFVYFTFSDLVLILPITRAHNEGIIEVYSGARSCPDSWQAKLDLIHEITKE